MACDRRLLQMTHAQWVYRNTTVHLKIKKDGPLQHMKQSWIQWNAFSSLIPNTFLRSIATYSFQTLLLLHPAPQKINLSEYLKWTLPSELRHTWPSGHATRCERGIAAAAVLGYIQSMSQFWCSQRGVWQYEVALTPQTGIGFSASLATAFPNSGWSGVECPLLKAPAFALPWWIRLTIISAVC